MYEKLKRFPTSPNAKMAYGILCAFVARGTLNEGIRLVDVDADAAVFAFMATAVLLYTTVLAMVRFNTGRPLFETVASR